MPKKDRYLDSQEQNIADFSSNELQHYTDNVQIIKWVLITI